jgi:hypothetical protein
LVKIYEKKEVVKLGSISSCLTGEIDMTFGKSALSNDPLDVMLIKGVQLDRYILKTKKEQISQGEIEYIKVNKLSKIISAKKLKDFSLRRIALQGLTGVNETRRLKGTIINESYFLANSSNYIIESNSCKLELILAWLNSKLLNFVFKTRSTSSNVNGYEVDNLPFCKNKYDTELINLSKSIMSKKQNNLLADTIELEKRIDLILYETFQFTKDEIKIIEESVK